MNTNVPPPSQTPNTVIDRSVVDPRGAVIDRLLNDPSVIYNPYSQYGIHMGFFQKQKLRRQIRLQMQAKSWFQDKYQFVLVQRNLLAIFTIVSLGASLASVYAVQKLAPLKTVEPFIIQIEEKTGITQLVEPLDKSKISSPEALDNYFLWAYVRARETYHPADQRTNWENTRIMSSAEVFTQYLNDISPNNPVSAAAVLAGVGTRVLSDPTITYLSNPERKVAQIRFLVEETFKDVQTRYPKIATIEYEYYEIDLKRAERLVNPLGFQVLSYRLDEEVVR
jgi:type IV secretion system protein VirB8